MLRAAAIVALLASILLAACGGSNGSPGEAAGGTGTQASDTTVRFPSASHQTLKALRAGKNEGAVFAPSVSTLRVGDNRVGFVLFDLSRNQVTPEAVALYVARPDGRKVRGPFMATERSLQVEPQFQSRQAQADLQDVNAFWTANVPFTKAGRYIVMALAQVDGKLVATSQFELRAGGRGGPPDVGDRAIRIHTLTPADVGGNLSAIDTRVPPLADLVKSDFADVVGKQPVVLVFATPRLCQTRMCGPVVDVAAQVAHQTKGVTFIHQEIYEDNDINKGFRPQVTAWHLPTEPWVFVVGKDGRIAARFEGPLSVDELAAAVKKVEPAG